MARLKFEVAVYVVDLHGLLEQTDNSGVDFKSYARIVCTGNEGETLALYFLSEDSRVPTNWYDEENKWGRSFLPLKQYALCLDLLRNESPVYAILDSDRPSLNCLRTSLEPTGDGEF